MSYVDHGHRHLPGGTDPIGFDVFYRVYMTIQLWTAGGSHSDWWQHSETKKQGESVWMSGTVSIRAAATNYFVLKVVQESGGNLDAINPTLRADLIQNPTKYARASRSAVVQSIPTGDVWADYGGGTEELIHFTDELDDTDGMVTLGSNDDRITVVTAGTYIVTGSLIWNDA